MDNNDRQKIKDYQAILLKLKKEIKKVIVGLEDEIDNLLIALLSNGHILLEGLPGLGKTMLVRTLAEVMDLEYSRIQFTPDLMPADIIGTNILMEDDGKRFFEFQNGPIFGQIILADEINRATPKTQAALLEAMQERNITVAGKTRKLKEPFFVLATQNPLEMEGTYPLPEAQIDRFFFKIHIGFPNFAELKEILMRTTVGNSPQLKSVINAEEVIALQEMVKNMPVSTEVVEYVIRLVMASQPQKNVKDSDLGRFVNYGSSPRGAQALILASKARAFLQGRFNVSFQDVRTVAYPALRHRILLSFEGEASAMEIDDIIHEIIKNTPELE